MHSYSYFITHIHCFFIKSTIVGDIKVRAVVCFHWVQFSYDLTHFIFLMHSHSYLITHIYYLHFFITPPLQFLLWIHIPCCWNDCCLKWSKPSWYIMLLQIHDYRIDYYYPCHNYFTVCALQVKSFIVLFIQSTIAGNSEVRAVVCFHLIQCWYNLTHSIFSNALTFILHYSHLLFSFYILSHSYYNFTLKPHSLLLKTISY